MNKIELMQLLSVKLSGYDPSDDQQTHEIICDLQDELENMDYKFQEKLAPFAEELDALFVERSVTETILYEFYNDAALYNIFVGHEVALNKIFFSAARSNTSFNKVVPFLVECGINVNEMDPWGRECSSVDLALNQENIELADFLHCQGATLNQKNISQLTQYIESKVEGDSAQIESGSAASSSELSFDENTDNSASSYEPTEVPLSGSDE